jgi:hypothetical protein
MGGSKWMVDVEGSNGEGGGKAAKAALQSLDFAQLIEAQGSLAATVQAFIVENNYAITDRGGGDGSWHVGVPFNDLDEAVEYLKIITKKFSVAIGGGLLRVELKTWSTAHWRNKDGN